MTNMTYRYAGLWIRFFALSIDFVIFCAVFFPITKIVKGTWLMTPADHRWASGWFITDPLCITFLIIMIAYFILLEGFIGMTLGKMMLRIRVIDMDGNIPGLKKSIIRNVLRFIDGLPALNILGIVLIVTSAEKTRFGDRVAKTRVIRSST